MRASGVGPSRADRVPGNPSSASTSRPESSPIDASPDRSAAASALSLAFSAYVSPTSSTPVSNPTSSTPESASRSRYSRSLPWLPDATTRRGRSGKRGDDPFLGDDQLLDPLLRQREHRVQLGARVGSAFRRGLQLDESPVLGHDAVQVGGGLVVLGVIEVEHRRALHDAAAHGG